MKSDPWVLGISVAPHNGAMCLLKGDEIVVAIQEERLSRRKRDAVFGAYPSLALNYCLDYAGIRPSDLSLIVSCPTNSAKGASQDISLNPILETKLNRIPTLTIPHHFGHALSAFATSGFEEAAVLVIDGYGAPYDELTEDERAACRWPVPAGFEMISLYHASGTSLKALEKHLVANGAWLTEAKTGMPKFGSLGGMYSAVAAQIFGDIFEAGKVMGLAPYGRPVIPTSEFYRIDDGKFVFLDDVPKRFRHRDRWPIRRAEYEDLAASTQSALEEAVLYLVEHLHKLCPVENFCYAGGVALNSVTNERIIGESSFKNVYIIPSAEDSGTAIGAAYYGLWQLTNRNTRSKMICDAVGREYSSSTISEAIESIPAVEPLDCEDIISETANLLKQGNIVGWFQGRSELGPRALGQRSILCDPRRPDGKETLNSRVKHREGFRPFAPVVPLEEVKNYFDVDGKDASSPFMLRVCSFNEEKKDKVPAVVHVDGTGRFQTVTRQSNKPLYDLIEKFSQLTGVPVLLNTSFNVMGEPIVETPKDAILSFLSTGIDYCVLGDRLIKKRKKILFEEEDLPWCQRIGDRIEAITSAAVSAKVNAEKDGRMSADSARPLEEYTGVFEHPSYGVITTTKRNGQLEGTLCGGLLLFKQLNSWTTPLVLYSLDVFEVVSEPFKGIRIVFIESASGRIDCAVMLIRRGFSRDIIFTRRTEANSGTPLDGFAGNYEAGDKGMQVILRAGNRLFAAVPGQSPLEIIPDSDGEFSVKGIPGYSIRFEFETTNSIESAIVTQPSGTFVLKKKNS